MLPGSDATHGDETNGTEGNDGARQDVTWADAFLGQALVGRTMRPTLDAIAMAHHTLTDEKTMPFIVDRSIKQAVATQAPVTFILSPLLTGGKAFTG
jgi:hypothetical protein